MDYGIALATFNYAKIVLQNVSKRTELKKFYRLNDFYFICPTEKSFRPERYAVFKMHGDLNQDP